ncbi:hypothetical protein JTE90_018508 [Oedothorax gibbosus]|uniref:Uncharacterized protein n=1 Tax=Oedothorax gibbosus TaxID=931172 RepID=A0AAV6V263_9ARAC|nr:hypothetical protein JTE90_018508 [Oedothorax gibbosus]
MAFDSCWRIVSKLGRWQRRNFPMNEKKDSKFGISPSDGISCRRLNAAFECCGRYHRLGDEYRQLSLRCERTLPCNRLASDVS